VVREDLTLLGLDSGCEIVSIFEAVRIERQAQPT
jgi:hypothetical protein